MHTYLLHSLAQQHIDDLQASADRRRASAQARGPRPTLGSRLARIVRLQRRTRAAIARIHPVT